MKTNRLSRESSPYLLQHQHNPVDWHAWGPEAFDIARRENKPIFLSVGYSTCYWCHVMERQSFENETVAEEMNRRFVNIKVDREERPDVDQLYMTAVQILARQGGWPMSVFLTPDLRPFYGGTYFPPTDSYGRPGFMTLLGAIDDAWQNRGPDVEKTATQLVGMLKRLAEPASPKDPIAVEMAWIDSLIERSVSDFDPQHGGFGGAPKFPRETLLELLLIWLDQTPVVHSRFDLHGRVRLNLLRTLDAMAMGGIRDHLGGGFHRYSTDAEWLVPHFEIMLYDNAMLAWCYAEAHRQTSEPRYAEVARGILDFVLREMTSPAGAFYTAFDAEVDAREGEPYLWTKEQIEAELKDFPALPGDPLSPADLFNRVYGVDRGPNFSDPHHGSGTPDKNILFLPQPIGAVWSDLTLDPADLTSRLAAMRERLYAVRKTRKQPLLDTKILTSWNALMIRAFAHAGKVLGEEKYLQAASRAAEFLLQHHFTSDGALLRTSGGGLPASDDASGAAPSRTIPGFLDDYAFLCQALLALDEAGIPGSFKTKAEELARQVLDRFGDAEYGGFYFTDRNATDLVVRQKTASDSPLPSGNAVAAMVLLELGQAAPARHAIAAFTQQVNDHGEGMSSMVQAALLFLRHAEPFIVSAEEKRGDPERPLTPQQMADSVVTPSARWQSEKDLLVKLHVREGFHINAHDVGNASIPLIPTTLRIADVEDALIDYPPGQEQSFEFSEGPLRVYAEEVKIVVKFRARPRDADTLRITLAYQACNESACLPPTTVAVPVEN